MSDMKLFRVKVRHEFYTYVHAEDAAMAGIAVLDGEYHVVASDGIEVLKVEEVK